VLSFLKQYAKDYVFSQNGEEGILLEAIRRLEDGFQLNKGHAVEIGGNDGRYCSNTALLLQQHGWSGLFVESDYNLYLKSRANWAMLPDVRHQCSRVDERNVNAFVDERCVLLSLDTDGSDHKIFCGMEARPKIVIVEIDSSIEPPSEAFNSDGAAGYWSMTVAALERGYFVLCHTGNLIIVRQDYAHLFPECAPHPLLEWELYFNRGWL
jgi:hypothetical protein